MAKKQWNNELRAKIIARAWKDENFRKELIDHPKKVLKEYGIDLPKNINISVVCNDSNHTYFVLPQTPSETTKLSESELIKMSAAQGSHVQAGPYDICTVLTDTVFCPWGY